MTVQPLIAKLRELDVKLWTEGDRLRYSAPPDTLTDDLLAELAAHKASICAWLNRTAATAASEPAIRPAVRPSSGVPASFSQQRLWFLDRMMGEAATYNMPLVLRLSGPLDRSALCRSLEAIVARHEVLRTRFALGEDGPVQVIADRADVALEEETLAGASEAAIGERITALAGARFDLETGPLFRAVLIALDRSGTEHVLLLLMHHIVSDGWSLRVLFRELSEFYRAYITGGAPSLAELPVQYADFAVWQRQWLTGPVLERQLGYWRERLAGLATLELATDRARPAVQGVSGSHVSRSLPAALGEELRRLGRETGATLFMTMLAGFAALLQRYAGQDDIVIGTPVANRNRAEIEGLIGFFVNMLVLRADLSGDPSFRSLIERVRAAALGAYDHQDLPFETLVEALGPERDTSRNPLFQVTFSLQEMTCEELSLGDLTIGLMGSGHGATRFDLEVFVWQHRDGLRLSLVYNTDLFEADTIERMAGHYEHLLDSAVADPDRPVSALALVEEAERRRLVSGFNDTVRPYELDTTIAALFAGQARRTPDAVAVECDGATLTYAALDARANRLANYLRRLGVGPDVPVGICLARGIDMVVAILGISKAGGAYVPLDPDYPEARIAFMLEDCSATVALCDAAHAGRLAGWGGRIVRLDADRDAIEAESADAPDCGASGDSLAYVIYTSGSTGEPKGACIEHRALVNHMSWINSAFALAPEDRVLQKTPFSFDASVWEFHAPLLTGGRLVMARPGGHRDAAYLVETIVERGITVLQAVPSLLRALLDEGIERCTSLRVVFCGGEALPAELVRRFRQALAIPLVNLYGVTEATIDSLYHVCDGPVPAEGVVPVGRPIANTQVHVLERAMQPAPIGVPGELCIGGDGLARGYLNRPELTAEKFVADPFSDAPGARLYKTGDIARRLPDGSIVFIGRRDHQVKLRGFRVELGEIEALLARHGTVGQCVVLLREDRPGDQRLIAYVAPSKGRTIDAGEIREYAKARLPGHMAPSAVVVLDALPLNAAGKIDRAALPAPDGEASRSAGAYVAPRSETETRIAAIWREVLDAERVGVEDNFFDLGGHSLLAIQVASRVRAELKVDLPLQAIFAQPTVAELARQLDGQSPGRTTRREAELAERIRTMSEEGRRRLLEEARRARQG